MGIALPPKRITGKSGPGGYRERKEPDLTCLLAAAVLAAGEMLKPQHLDGVMMAGEIQPQRRNPCDFRDSSHGDSEPAEEGCRLCVVPKGNLKEGRLVSDVPVDGNPFPAGTDRLIWKNPAPYLETESRRYLSLKVKKMSLDFS